MVNLINSFVTVALRSRYLTAAASILVILAGLIAFRFLPIEAYPELSNPRVRVITLLPGKGPEEVERLVTIPLEKELNGIPGQISLRSISVYALSIVTSTFTDSTQSVLARQQVLERIQQADLPEEAQPGLDPEVGSIGEIYRYCLRSPYYSPMGLKAIQVWEMEKLFRQIPGVIAVVSDGGPTKAYQISLDPELMRARSIKLKDVYDAVSADNGTTGGAFLEKCGNALIVRQLGLYNNTHDIENTVINANSAGIPIKIKDVGTVSIEPKIRRGQVGKEYDDDVVEGIVLLRRGENPSQVLDALYKRLPAIKSHLPPTVSLVPLYDRSRLVGMTLNTVSTNIAIGIALVVGLLGLFLLNLRVAVITACVIPISMLVAFIVLSLLNVPANLLSLGAIDFGILVDSAVVMTENVIRRLSLEGQHLDVPARLLLLAESAREVAAPVVFGVVVIIATFLPIFTLNSVEGKLFRPLAITMVAALVGAALAALTLVPVLCTFFLMQRPLKERPSPLIQVAARIYTPALSWSLKHPWLVVSSACIAFAAAVVLFANLGSEFLPHLEEGNVWLRTTIKPGSVTLAESVKVARQIRLKLLEFPEVTQVLSQEGGSDDGLEPCRFSDQEFFVDLKPAREWRPQFQKNKDLLIAAMRTHLEQIPGVNYYFTQCIQTMVDESMSGVEGSLVAKVAGADLFTLERLGKQVGAIMRATPGIVDVIVDPLLGQPQFVIEFDREAAARYGVNLQDLKDVVEIAVGGKDATKVIQGERRFDVIIRLKENYRSTGEAIRNILIDTSSGAKIPLSHLARLREVDGAMQIWREGGTRLSTIRANVHGRDLGTSVADAQRRVEKEIRLPDGYRVEWSGEFERQREATHQLAIVMPITMLVIMTVLFFASGSVRGALIMFSVVPLAAIGGVCALHLTQTYFSIAAGVGLIALCGVAVKNGILLVSFVNQLRQEGAELSEAVYKGALIRMRPVLMTASIAAIGLLPAAISTEIGSQTQRPFAIVVIGGLISSTLLTLIVLPTLYLRFAPSAGKASNNECLPVQGFSEADQSEAAGEDHECVSAELVPGQLKTGVLK